MLKLHIDLSEIEIHFFGKSLPLFWKIAFNRSFDSWLRHECSNMT